MNQYNENPISSLVRHCRMYMYASKGSPEPMFNEIASDFFTFGLLHLISTMFITTDSRSDPEGGFFHRVLDPLGYGTLLETVDDILDSPVGMTKLRQYIRSKRNKLAVHGSLGFSSQPSEVQDVTFDDEALIQFTERMHDFDEAVAVLERKLEELDR